MVQVHPDFLASPSGQGGILILGSTLVGGRPEGIRGFRP